MKEKPSKFADMLRTRKDGEAAEPAVKRGRPGGKGKRGNADYAQVTAYIPKTLHNETKMNLIRQGNREFSELVEELLTGWNQQH
jgi:hypothetical protein